MVITEAPQNTEAPQIDNYLAELLKKKQQQVARLTRKVQRAEFISLGSGTPYELINTCTLSEQWKERMRQGLINGNPKLLDKFEKYRQLHPIDVAVFKDSFDYSVSGDFVDVGRYMAGEPECMVDFNCQQETKFVDFYINIDVAVEVSEENTFSYYASALSVVDSLENSGYRVRLMGVNYSDNVKQGHIYEVSITIKDYNEPVNYAYLTSICMAHTDFFNAVMYRPGIPVEGMEITPNINLYNFAGCDYLPGFEPNITLNDNTFYAPSLFGRNREGVVYSKLGNTPGAFQFDNLIKDWKLDHLLVQ